MPPFDYPSCILSAPRVRSDGIEHLIDGEPQLLAWSQVLAARAAEVGEPQGVRTVVFDLLVEGGDRRELLRLDAEPGDEAEALARALATGLGDRALPSIKSLAVDGIPSRRYTDLGSFEDAGLEELGTLASGETGPKTDPRHTG